MKQSASNYYRNRKGNCAQAVAAAWHEKTAQKGGLADQLSGCGGGRAPEGVCGALHAAQVILEGEKAAEAAEEFSKLSGGHVKCRDIRSAGKLSCVGCVEVAAELLEKQAKQ